MNKLLNIKTPESSFKKTFEDIHIHSPERIHPKVKNIFDKLNEKQRNYDHQVKCNSNRFSVRRSSLELIAI